MRWSSERHTFNILRDRYKFLCLPFGIKSVSEVLQQNNEIFEGIACINIMAPNTLTAASAQAEPNQTLKKVMARAKAEQSKFNPDKI